MLLHAIGRMEPPGGTNTWLRKYIFPGGYSPALSEVLTAIEKSGLWVTDIEVLRLHYADTLRLWRQRFLANREKVRQIAGYDERFLRMWEFYLAGCEVAFRYMNQMVFQIQIARRQDAVPLHAGLHVRRGAAADDGRRTIDRRRSNPRNSPYTFGHADEVLCSFSQSLPPHSVKRLSMEPQKDELPQSPRVVELVPAREPPHNFEAEQALLGSILVNNAAYHRVAEFLKGEHFADPLHGKLFDALARADRARAARQRGHPQDLHRERRGHEGRRRRLLSRRTRRGLGARDRCRRFRPAGARSLPAARADHARRGRRQRRLQADPGRNRDRADRDCRKEALRPRQRRPDRRRLQAVPDGADRGHGRRRGGLQPRRPAHRRRHGTGPARSASGRPAQVRPADPGGPPVDGKRRRLPPTSPSTRSSAYREEHGEDGKPKVDRRRRRGILLARNVGRATRQPHPLGAGRASPRKRSARASSIKRRFRPGDLDQPGSRASQPLHRRHAGSFDRRAAYPRAPPQAHARARAADRRLPPAPQSVGQVAPGEPRAGGLGDHPWPQDAGQGTRRPGHRPVPAQPCRRATRGQAPAARRSPRSRARSSRMPTS